MGYWKSAGCPAEEAGTIFICEEISFFKVTIYVVPDPADRYVVLLQLFVIILLET